MDVCPYIVSMILTYVIFYVMDKMKTIRCGECCYYQVAVFEYSVSYRHDWNARLSFRNRSKGGETFFRMGGEERVHYMPPFLKNYRFAPLGTISKWKPITLYSNTATWCSSTHRIWSSSSYPWRRKWRTSKSLTQYTDIHPSFVRILYLWFDVRHLRHKWSIS